MKLNHFNNYFYVLAAFVTLAFPGYSRAQDFGVFKAEIVDVPSMEKDPTRLRAFGGSDFDKLFKMLAETVKKSEFETANEHQFRLDELKRQFDSHQFALRSDRTATYDADRGTFSINFKDIGSDTQDCVLESNTILLSGLNITNKAVSLTNRSNCQISFPVPREKAPDAKQNIRFLFIGSVAAPFAKGDTSFLRSGSISNKRIYLKLQEIWAVNRLTGELYARIRAEGTGSSFTSSNKESRSSGGVVAELSAISHDKTARLTKIEIRQDATVVTGGYTKTKGSWSQAWVRIKSSAYLQDNETLYKYPIRGFLVDGIEVELDAKYDTKEKRDYEFAMVFGPLRPGIRFFDIVEPGGWKWLGITIQNQ